MVFYIGDFCLAQQHYPYQIMITSQITILHTRYDWYPAQSCYYETGPILLKNFQHFYSLLSLQLYIYIYKYKKNNKKKKKHFKVWATIFWSRARCHLLLGLNKGCPLYSPYR